MPDPHIVQPVAPPTPEETKQRAAEAFAYGEERMRSLASDLVGRMQFAQQHGLTFGDKRDLYKILGYNPILTAREYGARYARGGIAGRIVDVYPNATWRGQVDIVEDKDPHEDTVFEAAWKALDRKHQIQAKLLRADKLSQLSTFSVILIGVPGRTPLSEPLPKATTPGKLLYLTPYGGGGGSATRNNNTQRGMTAYDADAIIDELEDDPSEERYGLPRTYQLRRVGADIGTTNGTPLIVHWTRVIHIAENVLWDELFGLPALERVWNLLDDLEKVTGGGAEAFWLRANQGMHLDIAKDMDLDPEAAAAAVASLKEQAEEYKHQLTRWLRTRGVSVTPLGSDVANFSSPADAILTQIAGSKGIPKRILTGSEMGELASSQDRDNWKDQINGRQTQYAGPYIIRPLITRLIEYGYLPTPKGGVDGYEVKWPNVQVRTDQEKADGAAKWVGANAQSDENVFTNDEIRDYWYGFEPLTPEQRKKVVPEPPPGQAANGQPPTGDEPAPSVDKKPTEADATLTDRQKKLKAARAFGLPEETDELVLLLEEAIACGNTQVIDEIIGLNRAEDEL